jgi:hypothetical protein
VAGEAAPCVQALTVTLSDSRGERIAQ